MPRVDRIIIGNPNHQFSEVGNATGFIARRLKQALDEGDASETAHLLAYVEQLREAYTDAMNKHGLDAHRRHLCETSVEPLFKQIDSLLDSADSPVAARPSASGVDGATVLFNVWGKLPEVFRRAKSIDVDTSEWIIEGSQAWLGIVATICFSSEERSPELPSSTDRDVIRMILTIDTNAGTSRLYMRRTQGHWVASISPLLAKSRTHIGLAVRQRLWVVPLDDVGYPDAGGSEFFSLAPVGVPHDKYWYISALANLGDDFYLGLSRPLKISQSAKSDYGGLFRWTVGDAGFSRIAASDSLEAGPLNDCPPYVIETIISDESSQGMHLRVQQDSGERYVWWQHTPPVTWHPAVEIVPPPDSDIPWRVTTAGRGARNPYEYSLVHAADSRETVWQSFPDHRHAEPGHIAVTNDGLLWVILWRMHPWSEEASPLKIHFIPKGTWGHTSPQRDVHANE